MQQRRVLITSNTAWNLANFRGPIIAALTARGDRVIAIAGEDRSVAGLTQLGCDVVGLAVDSKGVNPLSDLALLFRLRRAFAAHRPDVVLNFTIKPVIYGTLAARSLRIPVINTITGLGTAFIKDTWLTRIVEGLYKLALPGPRPVVFQNSEDLALFKERRLVTDNPCTIVAGSGIDLQEFRARPLPKRGPVTFLLIARLLKDKGIAEYVEAAGIVRTYFPQIRFQLLGPLGVANRTAISKAELSNWVVEGVIEYLGETDDVRPFIKAAHCVVLPSYREGMPRVLLEAAAMGRPLIATNVTGCRDVVDDGVNGYLCAARDAGNLAFKMRAFLDLSWGERQKMGNASGAIAEARFDVRRVVKTYLDLIDAQIVGRVPASGVARR